MGIVKALMLRNEFLNVELFDTMFEVEVLTKIWVNHYNTLRPHSSLRAPAPQTILVA